MKNIIYGLILMVFFVSCKRNRQDGASSVNIHVMIAGTLPNLISESEKYEITNLTLTGRLNGTDIRYINEMIDNTRKGKLSILNLADANIKIGGDESRFYNSPKGGYSQTKSDEIKHSTFCCNSGLTSITLPNSITKIGDGAFYHCIGLTSIIIPDRVTDIGEETFLGCANLTSITIGNSVISIGTGAIACCPNLLSATIGKSVTSIKRGVFYDCQNLSEIHILNSIPPECGKSVFENINADCILYVPKGSYQAYSIADGWKDFKNIIELD